jgi:hypothetical protein
MLRTCSIAVGLALLIGGSATAQRRPDFSGTWVMDLSRSESAAQAADASLKQPVTLVISQTGERLVIEQRLGGQSVVESYPLPGREPQPVGTSGPEPRRAQFVGQSLVTMHVDTVNQMAIKQTETRKLDPSGTTMTVETQIEVEHGYESNGGSEAAKASNLVRDVYVRSR